MILRRIAALGCAITVLSCVVACGSFTLAQRVGKDSADLPKLAKAYLDFEAEKGKGPADANEWQKRASKGGKGELVPLIQECQPGGRFVFHWGVKTSALPEGAVLGYSTEQSGTGHYRAVLADGSDCEMTGPELRAAIKRLDGDKK